MPTDASRHQKNASSPPPPAQPIPVSPSLSSMDRSSQGSSVKSSSGGINGKKSHYGSFTAESDSDNVVLPTGAAADTHDSPSTTNNTPLSNTFGNLYESAYDDNEADLAHESNDRSEVHTDNHLSSSDDSNLDDIIEKLPKKKQKKSDQFSNSCTFLISAVGSCVGSGNVWRFSRVVALVGGKKGAGCFLMLWAMFLFTWSMPLIVSEYAMGRGTRKTIVGTFWKLGGRFAAWMGIFMLIVNVMICCYYAVICGWCFYYLILCIFWPLPTEVSEATDVFNHFTQESFFPLLTHGIAIVLAAFSMIGGMKSIEKVNMVLVPGLLIIIFSCFIRSLFLPGAFQGIAYMFYPDTSILLNPITWIEALSQISFDTGAGWGLLGSYATGLSDKANIVKMGTITPCGNNMVSLVSGMTVFGTTFAMLGATMPVEDVLNTMRDSGVAGTGMTFIYFPVLFSQMWGGKVIAIFFFLALSFAALSSLISISNLPTKQLVDFGFPRLLALFLVSLVTFTVGSGSALSVSVLSNQDAVWGSALILMGLFTTFIVIKYGPKRFRTQFINASAGILWKQRRLYDFIMCVLVPVQAIILLGWWMVKSILDQPTSFWNPIKIDSLGTSLAQWSVVFTIAIGANIFALCFICIKRRVTKLPDPPAAVDFDNEADEEESRSGEGEKMGFEHPSKDDVEDLDDIILEQEYSSKKQMV